MPPGGKCRGPSGRNQPAGRPYVAATRCRGWRPRAPTCGLRVTPGRARPRPVDRGAGVARDLRRMGEFVLSSQGSRGPRTPYLGPSAPRARARVRERRSIRSTVTPSFAPRVTLGARCVRRCRRSRQQGYARRVPSREAFRPGATCSRPGHGAARGVSDDEVVRRRVRGRWRRREPSRDGAGLLLTARVERSCRRSANWFARAATR